MAERIEPMQPAVYRIRRRMRDLDDVFTIELEAERRGSRFPFAPGQFNMLYAFGLGEVPISISGDPAKPGTLVHTIRAVGAVTDGLGRLKPRDTVGVRGPFGTHWPVERAEGQDVVVAAGGLGLAPLRPAIYALLAGHKRFGRISILYGTRTPRDVLFAKELRAWARSGKIDVRLSVGQADRRWKGTVGHVTALLPQVALDGGRTTAFVCGPEIMMRMTAAELERRSVSKDRVFVSLERNMKCAIGFCGHCQFGPHFLCTGGPVFPYADVERLLRVREV